MRFRTAILLVVLSAAFCGSVLADDKADVKSYRGALELFQRGMYDRARTLFESFGDDPLYYGYAALCAGKMDDSDFPSMVEHYDSLYGKGLLYPEIHYQYALNFFDDFQYEDASAQFSKVNRKKLWKSEQHQYVFKYGFCSFVLNDYPAAKEKFEELEKMSFCQYTSAARYAMGYMNYMEKDFDEALKWFGESVTDPLFEELSNFYIVDCRFMKKDYNYVTTKGVELYPRIPAARQAHLSRIISESFLVLGDNEKALEYYDKDSSSRQTNGDSDLFYAGSVMYAVHNWQGAVDNYTAMSDRSDSLGQIASYQLANSYIQLKNKVGALDAFSDAAALSYDKNIQEDAFFNKAKLAFDLNSDGSFFEEYLNKYSTSKKGDQIYSYMALSRLVSHDYLGAIAAYDKLSTLDSEQDRNYLKANFLRAAQLIGAGSYADALPFLNSATLGLPTYDPFYQLSHYWIGECKYRTGDYSGAFTEFSNLYNITALDGKPEGDMLPYNLGYSAFKSGNYKTAAKWFDRFAANAPKNLRQETLDRRGDCDFAMKDYKAAVESYQKAIDETSSVDHIYPYYQQALSYGLDGQKKKKVEVLTLVTIANPGVQYYSQSLYELGRTLLDIDEDKRAIEIFQLLSNSTNDLTYKAKALIGEGMANANLRRNDSALQCYKCVVAEMPQTEDAQNALMAIEAIYQNMGLSSLYIEYLESTGLSSNQSQADKEKLYFTAAEQNFLAQNYSDAITALQRYLSEYKDSPYVGAAWFYLGECYRQQGDKFQSIEAYGKAVELIDEGSFKENALKSYAEIAESMQRFNEAHSAYDQLEQISSFDEIKSEARNGMMRCSYGKRDYEQAIADADRVGDTEDANYIKAKSLIAISRRNEAMEVMRKLSVNPSTDKGAEATWYLIQDAFDRGKFDDVRTMTYDFAPKANGQNYWLAKAFITLADSFAEQGNVTQAKATLDSIMDGYDPVAPDDDILTIVEEKLNNLNK